MGPWRTHQLAHGSQPPGAHQGCSTVAAPSPWGDIYFDLRANACEAVTALGIDPIVNDVIGGSIDGRAAGRIAHSELKRY